MMKIAVRHAQRGELGQAAQLVYGVLAETMADWIDEPVAADYRHFSSTASMQLRYDAGHKFWIAEAEPGRAAGMLEVKGAGHILMLFVSPAVQRRGVGRALLGAAFPGFPRLSFDLTVHSVPQSISAYERMGFTRVGDEQNVNGLRFVPMRLAAAELPAGWRAL